MVTGGFAGHVRSHNLGECSFERVNEIVLQKNCRLHASPKLTKIPCLIYHDVEIIPRSVLTAMFEGIKYLLCALGDGTFFYFIMDNSGTYFSKFAFLLPI